MATRSRGWTLARDPRTGVYTVRFRHAGQRYHRTTGESDRGEAQRAAARIVEAVASGRVAATTGKAPPIEDLFGGWIEAYAAGHSEHTTSEMERYAGSSFARFRTLAHITDASLADFARARLRAVSASTVKKELSAMRSFLAWCVERGVMPKAPEVPTLPRRAIGTPNEERAQKRVDLTVAQAEAFLAALPEGGRFGYPIRDLYRFLWETGLRIATAERLEVGRHWTKGRRDLAITADIDKARYAREVPVSDAARAILDRHTGRRKAGLVFGPCRARKPLLDAGRAIGLPEDDARRVGPHDFRHAAITRLANSGAPITAAAFLVGHKSIAMTARYVHASRDVAAKALEQANGTPDGTRDGKLGKVGRKPKGRNRP